MISIKSMEAVCCLDFGFSYLVIGILVEGRGCVISGILQISILIVPLWPPIIENMKDIQSVVEIFG